VATDILLWRIAGKDMTWDILMDRPAAKTMICSQMTHQAKLPYGVVADAIQRLSHGTISSKTKGVTADIRPNQWIPGKGPMESAHGGWQH